MSFQPLDSDVPPLNVRCGPGLRKVEERAECPAHPEVLFDTPGTESEDYGRLLRRERDDVRRAAGENDPRQARSECATARMTSAIHAGA